MYQFEKNTCNYLSVNIFMG